MARGGTTNFTKFQKRKRLIDSGVRKGNRKKAIRQTKREALQPNNEKRPA
ncbi:hypothetical protein BRO54_0756 [Geobacillus proteiniphilus]|uniref:Uncharacterized protein n=1 Tax=Geobacillus proteiniphilus TaxID=860353 RepID=A0A1Q5T6A0_9BACL|nr:hypothetical protein BRO54_0756 [Geobacillus proteiniphilus]